MVSEAKLRTKWLITSEGKMVSKVLYNLRPIVPLERCVFLRDWG